MLNPPALREEDKRREEMFHWRRTPAALVLEQFFSPTTEKVDSEEVDGFSWGFFLSFFFLFSGRRERAGKETPIVPAFPPSSAA